MKNSVLFIFVFILIFSWIFSGWPPIWQNPRIPPSIEETKGASGDVIILWDTANGSIPSGWTCISCTSGDAFYGVFPRAASTYGGSTAGADTHTHSLTSPSQSQGASGTAKGTNSSNKALLDTHTHTWGNITSSNGDVRPPFKNLNFIYKNNPTVIPANAIAIFDGSLPSGFTRYTALDGNYLSGYSDNATGGSATHIHTISASAITSGNASKLLSDSGSGASACTDLAHALPALNTDLTAVNNAPAYLEVIFAYNSSGGDISIPTGLIAFFDAAPSASWTIVSDASPWANSFLKGAATYGGMGGSSTDHNHSGSAGLTSDNCSSSLTNLGTSNTYTGAGTAHDHTVTYTISSVGSLPVYRDVILAKYSAPNISVSVFDSTIAYGIIPENSAKSTCTSELSDAQTVTNNGNVTENFTIRGQNSANWTLGATAGSDQYVHKFLNGVCSVFSGGTVLTTSNQSFATGVAVSGTAILNLQINTPNPSSVYTQQAVDVIITAVQQ